MEEIEPRITPSGLNLTVNVSPASLTLGSAVTASGMLWSMKAMSSSSVTFNWGDGNTEFYNPSGTYPTAGASINHSHVYTAVGSYSITISASATYVDGTTDSASVPYSAITVLPPTSPPDPPPGPPPPPPPPGPPPPPPPPPVIARVRIESVADTGESDSLSPPVPPGQFNVFRYDGILAQPLTIRYVASLSSTASSGMDFHSLPGTVTFAAGASMATISVTPIDDLVWDPDEILKVMLENDPSNPNYMVLTPACIDEVKFIDNELAPVGSGQGLYGRYYNSQDLTDLKTSRIDPTVNFNWAALAPPGTALPSSDQFSVRWTGKVEPRLSGEYTFYITGDDGARLWVHGVLLFDKWSELPNTWEGKIVLQAGQKYDIKIEYHEIAGSAQAILEWSHANVAREVIPTSQLFPEIQNEGTGLLGTYYNTAYLSQAGSNPVMTRIDPTVDFTTWGAAGPFGTQTSIDKFSVRWSGKVQPVATGSHNFYLNADDGVRLWVNNQLIIDDWTTTAGLRTSNPIVLNAGTLYDIQIEYYEWTGNAEIQLSWSYPNQTKVVVPSTQLYPSSAPPVYYPTGGGLTGTYMWNPSGNAPNAVQATWIDVQGVNFDWGETNPTNGSVVVPSNNYTVRWTGYVQPQYTERYSFHTLSDDGVIVWVDGKRAVSNFVDAAGETGPFQQFDLVAGQRYAITVLYYEKQGAAVAKLMWSSPSQPKQIIPSDRLYPGVPTPFAASGQGGRLVEAGGTDVALEQLSEAQWFVTNAVAPRSKATILQGIPFWRESGGTMLPLPGDVISQSVDGQTGWSGVMPPGAFKGPDGIGPCVSVALIPNDPTQKTFMLHFANRANVADGFTKVGFVQNGTPLTGYRAILAGAEWQDNDEANRARLYALDRVVLCLGSYGVPITAYVAAPGFTVDSNGWVYWRYGPGGSYANYEN